MKNLIKLMVVLVFCITNLLKVNAQQDFTGVWSLSTEISEFSISINQVNNVITGNHCSISNNGEKIDCAEATETTLVGLVVGDSITLTFDSSFSLEKGTANIKKINSSTIEWKIITKPKGDFYIPMCAILTKGN